MRGPIDFIVVGFEGKTFDGTILSSMMDAVKQKIIDIVALAAIRKDKEGNVEQVDLSNYGGEYVLNIMKTIPKDSVPIEKEDIDEVAELLENDTSAAILIVEQLWAKPLKKAIIDADGVLVAEGRIHPEAAAELS